MPCLSALPRPPARPQDMRLLFANCKKFNPLPSDPVRMACLKLSEVFENSWVSSGLCAEVQRAKRATAGIAAPKFEPDEYDAAAQPPKTNSHRSGEQPPRRMPVSGAAGLFGGGSVCCMGLCAWCLKLTLTLGMLKWTVGICRGMQWCAAVLTSMPPITLLGHLSSSMGCSSGPTSQQRGNPQQHQNQQPVLANGSLQSKR